MYNVSFKSNPEFSLQEQIADAFNNLESKGEFEKARDVYSSVIDKVVEKIHLNSETELDAHALKEAVEKFARNVNEQLKVEFARGNTGFSGIWMREMKEISQIITTYGIDCKSFDDFP